MKKILDKIRKTIKEHDMIQPGDSIVIGLSGGPDSVCMMHALWALQEEFEIGGLCAVHINHGLRGAESDGDQEYAAQLCKSMGVEFEAFRFDVAKEAEAAGIGTEDAGRRIRYQTFEEVRRKIGAQKIAVAHNMNDQAETVLMRIMRGTGIAGLGGIPYTRRDEIKHTSCEGIMSAHSNGMIIRPVLDLARAEIEEYCEMAGLSPHIDSTNKQSIYTRNRIRLEMIPLMAEHFNPNIEKALVRLSKQAAEDNDFIQQAAEAYINGRSVCRFDRAKRCLDIEGFAELHPSVAKRVIMTCAGRCGLEYNMASVHIDRVMELISSSIESKEVDLTQNHYARLSYGKLWFAERIAENTKIVSPIDFPFEDILSDGKAIILAGSKKITLRVEPISSTDDGSRHRSDADVSEKGTASDPHASDGSEVKAVLDFDRLLQKKNAVIRNRMAGDRISPKGMKGSKKLQDYFTDRKIPKHMRDDMILVVDGGKVLLAGEEAAGECCKTAESRRILTIEY